jgi:hypothetical protein
MCWVLKHFAHTQSVELIALLLPILILYLYCYQQILKSREQSVFTALNEESRRNIFKDAAAEVAHMVSKPTGHSVGVLCSAESCAQL